MKTKRSMRAVLVAIFVALCLAGCEEKPETMLASAKDHLAKNERGPAVIQLRNALQKNPDLAEARFLLGKALLETGDLGGSERELRKAADLNYKPDEAVPMIARILVQTGQFKKAITDFGAAKVDSADAKADLETTLAQARAYTGDTDGARGGFAAALTFKPGYPRALVGQARFSAAAGDLPGAIALVDTALATDPALTEGWEFKGEIAAAENRLDDALAAHRKAIETKSDYLPAHAMITTILMQQDKIAEATQQLETMKKVAPKNPQTLYLTALLAFRENQIQAAREAVQQFLKIAPENGTGLLLSARIDYQLGSYTQAESELRNLLSLAPKHPYARRLLVQTYLRMGKPVRALEEMQPILAEESVDADTLALIGDVYAQNGDLARASSFFEKAVSADPKSASRRTTLALTHLARGDGERSFRELEEAAASDTESRADVALVAVYVQQKKYDAALAAVAALQKKQPGKPLADNVRGGILFAKGDTVGARQSFQKAIAIDPAYFAAAENLARLDLADKKPEEARKRYESVLAKNPKSVDALLALARLRAQTGAPSEEVVKLITTAILADPNDSRPRLALIAEHMRIKEPKLAVTAAQDALAALPDRPDVIDAAGRAYLAAGNTNQALNQYTRLSQLQPDAPAIFLRIAEVQIVAGDQAAALESVRKALAIKPDMVEAQRMAIALDLGAGKSAAALATAREMQKQRPKESVGYLLEGDIRAKQKSWSEAAAVYRNGLRIVGTSDLAIRLAASMDGGGDSAEASKFAASWMKDHPADTAFRHYLGETAMYRKDYPAAMKQYLTILEAQPNDVLALNNLAWVAGQVNDPKAIQYAEKAVSLAPSNATILDTLGTLLVEKGDSKRGVEILQTAVGLAPNAATIRLNLARGLVKNGQKEGARKELDVLAKLGDKFNEQAEVAKLLQGL